MSARGSWLLLSATLAVTLAGGLMVGMGAEFDASVLVLSLAGVVLLATLRQMFAVVAALAGGNDGALARAAGAPGGEERSVLAQEQRRVLRAIKELDFDHAMGKLSTADHTAILQRYKLRAVELMRGLDKGGALHPQTVTALAQGVDRSAARTDSSLDCGACGIKNDVDARFCKACGEGLLEAQT